VLTRRLLLTGDCVRGGDLAHLGIFTEVIDGEFNLIKARTGHGVSKAFDMRDDHLEIPEP